MNLIEYFSQWGAWVPFCIVLGGVSIIHLALNLLYKSFYPRQVKSGRKWAAVVLKTLCRPFKLLIWFSGLSILVSLYAHYIFDVSALEIIGKMIRVGFISSLAWAFFIFAKEAEDFLFKKNHFDKTTAELFSKLSFMVIGFLTLLLVLPLFGIQIAGLVAFGGFSSIVVGFSAKEAIANVMGGIIIAVDKPFKIGEWIYSQDEKVEGVVEHIGWRMTKLRQFDKRPLFIPNSMFSSMVFINASRMTNRRIYKRIGVRYQDVSVVEPIMDEIREYIKVNKFADHDLYNFIHLDNFGDSSVELLFRIYLKTVKYVEYRPQMEKILLDVHKIIEKHGAEIAFQ